jgi:hypothetical protein
MSENFNKEGQISNEAQKQLPGAFQPSDEFYRVVSKKAPVLPLDEKFIQATALGGGSEKEIAEHHRAIFFGEPVRAGKWEVLRRVVDDIGENIQSGEAHEARLKQDLNGLDRYLSDARTSDSCRPWRVETRILVGAMLLMSMLYLWIEIHNGIAIAMGSGHEHLKKPWAAFLFSLLPCTGLGVFLKLISLMLESDRARWRFGMAVSCFGCAAAIAAVPVFALTYAGFLADPIQALVGQQGTGGRISPVLGMSLQIALCSMATAGLVIGAWEFIKQHRLTVKVTNPAWRMVKRDLDRVSEILRNDRELQGQFEGLIKSLEGELTAFIGRAVAAFNFLRLQAQAGQREKEKNKALLDDLLNGS